MKKFQLFEGRNDVIDEHASLGRNGPSLGQEDHCQGDCVHRAHEKNVDEKTTNKGKE